MHSEQLIIENSQNEIVADRARSREARKCLSSRSAPKHGKQGGVERRQQTCARNYL